MVFLKSFIILRVWKYVSASWLCYIWDYCIFHFAQRLRQNLFQFSCSIISVTRAGIEKWLMLSIIIWFWYLEKLIEISIPPPEIIKNLIFLNYMQTICILKISLFFWYEGILVLLDYAMFGNMLFSSSLKDCGKTFFNFHVQLSLWLEQVSKNGWCCRSLFVSGI